MSLSAKSPAGKPADTKGARTRGGNVTFITRFQHLRQFRIQVEESKGNENVKSPLGLGKAVVTTCGISDSHRCS